MKRNTSKKSGGLPAASPKGMNLEAASTDAFRAPSYPHTASPTLTDQATAIPDLASNKSDAGMACTQDDAHKNSTTSCSTPQEVERRESYHARKIDAKPSIRVYRFDEYGELSTTMIDGEAWCSLHDAARIAGVIPASITGFLPEGGLPVRGKPDHLIPDGVRELTPQGIFDTGIRLEALVPHFENARAGTYLSDCLEAVVKDAYTDLIGGKYAKRSSNRTVGPARLQTDGNKVRQHRLYDADWGEFRAVVLGTQVWINGADVSRCTGLETQAITRMAGESRTVVIPNRFLSNPDNARGTETYVLSDAVLKILNAVQHEEFVVEALDRWIANNLLGFSHQVETGAYVQASTLHKLLGSHLDYDYWFKNTKWKFRELFAIFYDFDEDYDFIDRDPKDPKIVLTTAAEIARLEGGFAGELTAILLRDGGYFHNGPINESADATLLRFLGLMPDRSGRVEARKFHEFVGDPGSFEEWISKTQHSQGWSSCHDGLIPIGEAYDRDFGEVLGH